MIHRIIILFQTNKTRPDAYVLDMIKYRLNYDWKYEFYNDNDVIEFFINNPLDDLPDIITKYNSFKKGALIQITLIPMIYIFLFRFRFEIRK